MSRQPQIALDHIHCKAICDEIGERLRSVLGPHFIDTPAVLTDLLNRLREVEARESPSIVPSIHEPGDDNLDKENFLLMEV
jgi:hypothetical protein